MCFISLQLLFFIRLTAVFAEEVGDFLIVGPIYRCVANIILRIHIRTFVDQ